METIELQQFLIHNILNINDNSLLSKLKKIVEKETSKNAYVLTKEEEMMLKNRISSNHKVVPNQTVFNEIEEWLKNE